MSKTMSLTALNELFDCAGLTGDQFRRPLGNSFSSLRDTLAHLLAVEWLWLERWRGRSPQTLPHATEARFAVCLSN